VPQLDEAAGRRWCRSPLDAFVLDRLAQAELRPAAEADRRVLVRRLCLDLTGLPPTPDEVAEFVGDTSEHACDKLVDRLLASPRYGEQWGRHWLDVVRFAETEGFEYDRHRPGAWRYRDYVVDSLNRDKPYDRFVLEQLAGDEVRSTRETGRPKRERGSELDPDDHELLVAAGFQRLGPVRRNAGNQELAFSRHEVLTEMADIVGTAFLGLTVGCARCHDHMFDEIPQVDYYRLQAFFAATHEHDIALASASDQADWKTRHDAIQAQIKGLKKSLAELPAAERAGAEHKLQELERSLPEPLPTISTVHNVASERTAVHVLLRGDTEHPGDLVGPRPLGLLVPPETPELPGDIANPRTHLARWITAPDNPLPPRVLANRLWQFHFGRGLVETANDFGVNGSGPTHPELLDWLARELVDGGWQLKRMHRLIVTSAVYRQSGPSTLNAQPSTDPDNRLLSHFSRRRLTSDELRDSMLLVSWRLRERLGGPSVVVPVEPDLVNLLYAPSQWTVTADRSEHDRRSVYLLAKRNLRLPFMEVFDQPDAQTSCARRESSTHALQALELLNGRLSTDLARSFAQRLRVEAGDDPARQVEHAWRLATGRRPTSPELERSVAFLRERPLSEFALAMFNLNEFLTVD
jgi:hypothetical protein